MNEQNRKKQIKCYQWAAYNERFYESGGVCPPEHLCVFASAPPAQAFVKPPLASPADVLALRDFVHLLVLRNCG
jgi:hypothetical protein